MQQARPRRVPDCGHRRPGRTSAVDRNRRTIHKRRNAMAGQPKAPFYVVVALVVVGLVAFAPIVADILPPRPSTEAQGKIDACRTWAQKAESPDRHRAASPRSRSTASSRPSACRKSRGLALTSRWNDNTVRFALNVWAGWAPIILANNGFKAEQGLENARRRGVQGRAGAHRQPGGHDRAPTPAGEVHIGWGTLDMIPLFVDGMVDKTGQPKDKSPSPCPASSSRSTGPTAATASWSATTSRPWPTCATRSSCWRRTRRRSTSP